MGAVLPFSRSVMRGRKRAVNSIYRGAGDCSLMFMESQGESPPGNVVRFQAARDEAVSNEDVGMLLALAIFATLPSEQKDNIKTQIRGMKYGSDQLHRARATAVDRIINKRST